MMFDCCEWLVSWVVGSLSFRRSLTEGEEGDYVSLLNYHPMLFSVGHVG